MTVRAPSDRPGEVYLWIDAALTIADLNDALSAFDSFVSSLDLPVARCRQVAGYEKGETRSRVAGPSRIAVDGGSGTANRLADMEEMIFGPPHPGGSRRTRAIYEGETFELIGNTPPGFFVRTGVSWVNIHCSLDPEAQEEAMTAFRDRGTRFHESWYRMIAEDQE